MLPSDLLSRLLKTHLSPTDLVITPDLIAVALTATTPHAACPACGQHSDRISARYRRLLADLPLCGRTLVLILRLRKFLCRTAGCPRHIFCERIPELAAPHARSTARLAELHRTLGLALGCEPGSRLAGELAVPTSGDTIRRRVKATPAEPEASYRFVGLDDFALRKGQTYGTILVDLQRHRVIDLFDGRDGSAVEAWLKAHPEVEVVTRDRWAAYANACSTGAPQATQVADRFHLVGNLRELVERLFEEHAPALDAALAPPPAAPNSDASPPPPPVPVGEHAPPAPPAPPPATAPPGGASASPAPATPAAAPELSPRQQRRRDRFDEVRRLRADGRSIRWVARELRISPRTVIGYTRRTSCPDWNPGAPRPTRVDRFRDDVDAFVRGGGRSATVLRDRLKGLGCPASYQTVWRFLGRRLEAAGVSSPGAARGPPRPHRPAARQLSFEYVRRPEDRSEEAAGRVAVVDGVDELRGPLGLVREFLAMVRRESQTPLSDWLSRAAASVDRSVRSFAASVGSDEEAVGAAMSTVWSNGPSEGHVNRLKAIKRSMYGRASLGLLRTRVCVGR